MCSGFSLRGEGAFLSHFNGKLRCLFGWGPEQKLPFPKGLLWTWEAKICELCWGGEAVGWLGGRQPPPQQGQHILPVLGSEVGVLVPQRPVQRPQHRQQAAVY